MHVPRRGNADSGPGRMDKIARLRTGELKPFPGNPRRHPESQIAGLMQSIRTGLQPGAPTGFPLCEASQHLRGSRVRIDRIEPSNDFTPHQG
jgi:hypothetical protein